MRRSAIAIILASAGWCQSPQTAMDASRDAIEASVRKQRLSILNQVSALTGKPAPAAESFFAVPWIESAAAAILVPAASAPCEPLPAAQVEKLVQDGAGQAGVAPDLVRAVLHQESGGRPCAVSSKGAQGLMQIMPATAIQLGLADPFEPRQNVEAGAKLLKQLLDRYKGDISLALSAYNAGESRVDRDGGIPPIPETVQYVTSILAKLPKAGPAP